MSEKNIYRTNKEKEWVKTHPEDSFTRIHNEALLNDTLSDGAKCLLFYCLTKPDSFVFYVERVAIELGKDRKTILANFEKLFQEGYCQKHFIDGRKNRYIIFESPKLNFDLDDTEKALLKTKEDRLDNINQRKKKYEEKQQVKNRIKSPKAN